MSPLPYQHLLGQLGSGPATQEAVPLWGLSSLVSEAMTRDFVHQESKQCAVAPEGKKEPQDPWPPPDWVTASGHPRLTWDQKQRPTWPTEGCHVPVNTCHTIRDRWPVSPVSPPALYTHRMAHHMTGGTCYGSCLWF